MTDEQPTAEFKEQRPHLRAVAYRMLGSVCEADDAVQEAWLRASRANTSDVEDMCAWLTTVVARVSLNMLRSRRSKREEPLGVHVPEPIVSSEDGLQPEHEALLADSVGLTLLVVLETLNPAERLAYVLNDMFAMPFDDIAPIVERSPAPTRQLASRARRRVEGEAAVPDPDLGRQREVVGAFTAASREGNFERLVAVLHPDVVLRANMALGVSRHVRGAEAVARQARMYHTLDRFSRPALVNGTAGIVVASGERIYAVMGFTVADGKIVAIDILADPPRLEQLALA
ncbi:MAG: sigma-70 family RNA polymerase sigma factor [Solirubrobacteraceae bacterium]